ncbi:amidohydrolase family protein [Nocardioides nitrophenolicus]|uniref:amidohydrolase family protein n=1 Tax=Nocardioides nitrophenolicus TaxID=60489 RepID=UPI00195EFDA5|nr:amidohydrolase family protein [Nocardioides nitrophenolicus]MBM7516451.1 L-fuconolactonase [Nocardioides nitrophenolicus]
MIDAHAHLWRLGDRPQPWLDPATMALIHRDHEWPELEAGLDAAGVAEAVLVQVVNDPDETTDFLDLAARTDRLAGVVGWTDLLAPDVGDRLDELAARGPLVGVRHQAQAEADPGAWLAAFAAGPGPRALAERDLACDLMLRPAQLELCAGVVASYDELHWVLDHAGKPPVAGGWRTPAGREWARLVARLGELPQLRVKLSGLTTMADPARWSIADLEPWVDHLLAVFGPDRLLFGSDWPVSRRAGEYARTVDAVRVLLARLSPAEQDRILRGVAVETYRLRRSAEGA